MTAGSTTRERAELNHRTRDGFYIVVIQQKWMLIMRHIIAAFALAGLFSPLALAGERRPATTPAQITCGALPGVPSRIAYAAPQASACCAEDAACARLLATTVIKHGHGDLHT